MAEDAPNTAVLTDSTPQDNGVNLVSSGSEKEKNDSPSQKASQVSESSSRSFEDKLAKEEEKRMRETKRRQTLIPRNFRLSLKESKESTRNR